MIKNGRTVQMTDDVPMAPETERLLERGQSHNRVTRQASRYGPNTFFSHW